MASTTRLGTLIDSELKWREPELAVAKLHLQSNLRRPVEFRAAYRSFVAMTYAHYEGFTKLIIAQAMEEIELSGIKREDCNSIILMAMTPYARKFIEKASNADLLTGILSGKSYFSSVTPPKPDIVLECGNLDVSTFGWAISLIGLDAIQFASSRRAIGRITSLRHKCAHGEALSLDPLKTNLELANEIFDLQADVTFLMHAVAVTVLDHIAADGFK